MGNYARKIQRQQLKKELGNNNINELFHSKNDPLWLRLRKGMERATKKEN